MDFAWIGKLASAMAVVTGLAKAFVWLKDRRRQKKADGAFAIPKKTLDIAKKVDGFYWWSMGRRGDEPTMQIVGSFLVSNISSIPVRITQTELRCGFLGRKCVNGVAMVPRSAKNDLYGLYDIPTSETRNCHLDFWLYPPVVDPPESFTAHSVTVIDQFGNRHSVKKVTFTPSDKGKPTPKRPSERAYRIADPVEKEVVAALQAELGRFKQCGRQVGGLGSVHIVYDGRAFTGMGTDSWQPDSPGNQLIVSDPEAAVLQSDNLDSLLSYYRQLDDEDKQNRLISALTDRLSPDKGYLEVAYFIVCVLFKIGELGPVLRRTKQELPAGDNKTYGLSNVLMLLNGLLKYRHPEFSAEMLDEVERLIDALDEHPFLIPERLSTIRAKRLG